MRVLLTEPISDFIPVRAGFYSPPRGILSIAAYLEKHGFNVKVLEPWISRLDWKNMLKFISKFNPKVVGITSVTCNTYHSMALAKLIKQIDSNIIIVVGGHHFSFVPKESLTICEEIDYIVTGEGEETFLELLRFLREGKDKEEMQKVKGLAFKMEEEYIRTPSRPLIKNIDRLPIPAYHLLPFIGKINVPLARNNTVGCTFSRGCTQRCIFCSESLLWENKRRGKSARRIIEELKLLVKKYKRCEFSFNDTDFLYDRQRNIEFLEELVKANLPIKFRIASRVDTIIKNKDLLEEMKKLGLISVAVGIESFSQENLVNWNKKIDLKQINLMSKQIKKTKIPVLEGLLMIGRNEKLSSVWKILKKASRLNIDILWCSILTPFPKTPLYKEKILEGAIKVWDYRKYDFYHAVMIDNEVSIGTTERYNVMVYFLWFYNPVKFLRNFLSRETRRFQLFQLIFDLRILWKFIYSTMNNLLGLDSELYNSLIENFCEKHHKILNRKLKDLKTIKIWKH